MDAVIDCTKPELPKDFTVLGIQSEKKICFVCTGNTCRSPMAAAVTNELFGSQGISATSAGLYPNVGQPISDNAVNALFSKGFKPSSGNQFDRHIACAVSEDIILSCDTVVAISKSHMMSLIMAYPSYAGKITVMPTDISDPYGGDISVYTKCLDEIIKGVKELFGFGTDKGRTL